MKFWSGEVENKIMTKEALRDAIVVSPSSPTSNNQDICTEIQTDWLSHGLMDPCSSSMKVHEKRQKKRFLLEGDEKEYSVFVPQEDDIARFYTPAEPLGILSDARVFTLKPEYRKDNRPDEKDPFGTKVGVLKINGLWFRVILPHDSDFHSLIGTTKESEDESHIFQSPVLLQQSSNLNIVKPSSKVGRTLYVAFNQPMTPDEIRMKLIPSTKVRNLTQYSGQLPFHTQISTNEDPFDCSVVKKRKCASTSNSHDTMIKKQKYCKSTNHTHENKFAFWTAEETQTLEEWMEKIDNGVATWDDVAEAIKSKGRGRTVDAIRVKYSSLKKLCTEDWRIRSHWTTEEEETLKMWRNKIENGVASWEDAAAAVSSVGRERSIKACQTKYYKLLQERNHFSLGAIKLELKNSSKRGSYCCSESGSEGWSTTRLSESDMSSDGVMRQHERWTVKEEQTLKKWVNMVKNGDVSWKKAAAAVSSAGRERTISACKRKYHSLMQKKVCVGLAKENPEVNGENGDRNLCNDPEVDVWNKADTVENESDVSHPVGSQSTRNVFSFITSWIPKLFRAD